MSAATPSRCRHSERGIANPEVACQPNSAVLLPLPLPRQRHVSQLPTLPAVYCIATTAAAANQHHHSQPPQPPQPPPWLPPRPCRHMPLLTCMQLLPPLHGCHELRATACRAPSTDVDATRRGQGPRQGPASARRAHGSPRHVLLDPDALDRASHPPPAPVSLLDARAYGRPTTCGLGISAHGPSAYGSCAPTCCLGTCIPLPVSRSS